MAKRKKKSTRRRRSTKKKTRKRKSKPLGVGIGALLSGAQMATARPAGYTYTPIEAIKTGNFAYLVQYSLPAALKETKNYYPFGAGIIVSAAPSIPVLGILARPASKAIRDLTKGKYRL